VLRAVDLHQFAQTLAPPVRLMRGGQAVPPIGPQPAREVLSQNSSICEFNPASGMTYPASE
jgi:hypothetical protein